MSIIAQRWAQGVHIGNLHAKYLLLFLSGHNFHKPGFHFKIETLVNILEMSANTIRRAFNHLVEMKIITKEHRFDKNGKQLPNVYYLNISDDYLEKYEDEINKEIASNKNSFTPPPTQGTPPLPTRLPPPNLWITRGGLAPSGYPRVPQQSTLPSPAGYPTPKKVVATISKIKENFDIARPNNNKSNNNINIKYKENLFEKILNTKK